MIMKKRSVQLFIILTAIILNLAACTGTGTTSGSALENQFSDAYVRAHLKPGKTTEQDVTALYGPPTTHATDSNNYSRWTYSASRTGTRGMLGTIAGIVPGVGMANALDSYDKAAAPENSRLFLYFRNGILESWSF